jgi:hypothetical protein
MIRRIFLAIGMAALCIDATAKPKPLPMPLAAELPVEVVMAQHELEVDVPETASAMGAQFGLIGALIGSAVQNSQVKKAEERVVPIRDQLLAYRFNERVEAVLRAKLASDGLSPRPSIKVMQTRWDAAEAQANTGDMPLHALVIVPRYSMDAGFNTLSVSFSTQLVDRTLKANGKVRTKYLFSRNYAFRFPLAGAVSDENPQRWASMGSARLAGLLDQGVEQAADMLVYDFSSAGRAEWEQKIKRETATVKGLSYPGRAVRQGEDWVWARSGNSFVVSTLQGYQPVDPAAPAPVAQKANVTAADIAATSTATVTAAAPAAEALPDVAPAAASDTSAGGQ